MKSTKDPRQDSMSSDRDLNMGPFENKTGTLPSVLEFGFCYHYVCYLVQTSLLPPACSK